MPSRGLIAGALTVLLIAIVAVFGILNSLSGAAATVFSFGALLAAAVLVGALLLRDSEQARARLQNLRIGGAFLVAPVALFALAPGAGPPELATAAVNAHRYVILTINPLLVGAGFALIAAALASQGERRWAPAAAAFAIPGAVLGVIFGCIKIAEYRHLVRQPASVIDPILESIAVLILYFACQALYLASASAAISLSASGRMPRLAARIIAAIAAGGFAALAFRGLDFPSTASAFGNPAIMIGWIAGIPGVPWLVSAAIGIIALWNPGQGDPMVRQARFSRHG